MSQALNRLRATVSLPKYSPPMPRPPTGDRGWMVGSGGVESAPWEAAPQMGEGASADSLRWNLDLVLDQRGADMADLPDGGSELMVRDYKGKETDTLVYNVDTGLRGNGCARRSWLANEREPGP